MPVELMSKGRNKWENRSYQKSENHNSLGWEDSKATSSPEQICLLFLHFLLSSHGIICLDSPALPCYNPLRCLEPLLVKWCFGEINRTKFIYIYTHIHTHITYKYILFPTHTHISIGVHVKRKS